MKQTIREKLIDTIVDLASDEIESVEDMIKYAKMSEEELVDNLINIANYYFDKSN
jgi:hypothetical protein